jgi:twitching motility protein PilT
MNLSLTDALLAMKEQRASDLHIAVGVPPTIRVRGTLRPLEGYEPLTAADTREAMYTIMSDAQRQRLETDLQLDFAHMIPGEARFRVNVYRQRATIGAAFRLIPAEIPELDSLGLPPSIRQMTTKPRGLILVTGPTGSGKSTTLAAMLDVINQTRSEHIMTVEDPIEFLHSHKRCLVNQREVGHDTHSFSAALKAALRQDPDVILVGELRDLETISTALTAAETGHVVYATLHTQDTPQTIDRVIDVFPSEQQDQVRTMLSVALQGIMTQQLLPTADGAGRTVAVEVLVPTPAIRNLIREGKTHQIYSALQTGQAHGMQTMDASLAGLVREGTITRELALSRAGNPEELTRLLNNGVGAPAATPSLAGVR